MTVRESQLGPLARGAFGDFDLVRPVAEEFDLVQAASVSQV